jgi:hypothetical protein
MKSICYFLTMTAIAFSICACLSDKLQDPDRVPIENSLVLSSAKYSLAIGGQTTRVYARVPSTAGLVDVTFSTSMGAFIQAGPKVATIKQLSDSLSGGFRWAAVTLASDPTTKGSVYVTAEAKGLRQRIILTFN